MNILTFKANISRLNLGLCLIFSLNVASAEPLISWQSKDYIKKAFFEIAYKNEYVKSPEKLKRWNQPIRYQIDYFKLPVGFDMAENMIGDHFKDLSDITALPIVENDDQPNYRIIFTKQEHYKEAIGKYTDSKVENISTDSNCLVFFKHFRYAMVKSTVIIPVDRAMRDGFLPSCIVEELTQGMGLPNDSDWVNPSVANDKSVFDLLTGLDYLMLKILYDKRLEIGMNVEQSNAIVDEILLEFEQQNIIKNSISVAKKLRLSQQLDF